VTSLGNPLETEPQLSAQDDYVNQNLAILRDLQMSGMDPEEYLSWQATVDDVNDEYVRARAIEKDDKRTAEERKRAKEVADGIAKAAPAITKSVISAIKAFNKGDSINGAADIMDICASLAPLISTFLDAAGPEGPSSARSSRSSARSCGASARRRSPTSPSSRSS
jgi:hypothetical protein